MLFALYLISIFSFLLRESVKSELSCGSMAAHELADLQVRDFTALKPTSFSRDLLSV